MSTLAPVPAALLSARARRGARRARPRGPPRASASGDDGMEPMSVPEDAFQDARVHNITPERKAAVALGNLFTMAATRVILDQFTGTRHRSPVYNKMVRATTDASRRRTSSRTLPARR